MLLQKVVAKVTLAKYVYDLFGYYIAVFKKCIFNIKCQSRVLISFQTSTYGVIPSFLLIHTILSVWGTFPKAFPKGDFPSGNFPNLQFPKRQLPKG